jgi:hypothetical protein
MLQEGAFQKVVEYVHSPSKLTAQEGIQTHTNKPSSRNQGPSGAESRKM